MPSIKPVLITSLCAMSLMACNAEVPSPDSGETPSPEQMGDAPEIGTLTFDEIDLAGCGMSLWAPGSDSRADGCICLTVSSLPTVLRKAPCA
jgi:hypothetical protein